MTLNAKAQARMEQLVAVGEQIKATAQTIRPTEPGVFFMPVTYVDAERAREWAMNVLAILKSTLGEDNENYKQVQAKVEKCSLHYEFCVMLACLKAALADLKGGYFFEAKALLEAEVFSDLLEQADELQKVGYKDAAAVLGGGVLEKYMRSMCVRRGIGLLKPSGKHKMLNDMNDELAKAGAYNAMKKKQVTAWADLRNNAAHGNTTAYTAADVTTFLQGVSDFCANFS